MQFGASSEKLGREIEQLELALEELETERDVSEVETAAPGVAPRLAPVRSLPEHLPREEVVHEPASGICTCPDCGGALRRLGVDAHEMLDIVPVRWRVVRNVRPKYSCRSCEKIVRHLRRSALWRGARRPSRRWRTSSSPSSTTICRCTARPR
jgi:hypothetical protein